MEDDMFSRERAVKISSIVLFCLGIVDLLRGLAHTSFIKCASITIAKMPHHPDALMMMCVFGNSNFLQHGYFAEVRRSNAQDYQKLFHGSVFHVLDSLSKNPQFPLSKK